MVIGLLVISRWSERVPEVGRVGGMEAGVRGDGDGAPPRGRACRVSDSDGIEAAQRAAFEALNE